MEMTYLLLEMNHCHMEMRHLLLEMDHWNMEMICFRYLLETVQQTVSEKKIN